MRWVGLAIALSLMVGLTGWAVAASISGAGLPGLLDKPVSVRQGSRSGGGVMFIYWGGVRRHYGGGYGYGK